MTTTLTTGSATSSRPRWQHGAERSSKSGAALPPRPRLCRSPTLSAPSLRQLLRATASAAASSAMVIRMALRMASTSPFPCDPRVMATGSSYASAQAPASDTHAHMQLRHSLPCEASDTRAHVELPHSLSCISSAQTSMHSFCTVFHAQLPHSLPPVPVSCTHMQQHTCDDVEFVAMLEHKGMHTGTCISLDALAVCPAGGMTLTPGAVTINSKRKITSSLQW
jgi:hypothetical protein